MQELYCPQCSALIPEGERVCPSCGFDLAEFDKEAEEEFNALLNAANKKLSEESDGEDGEDGEAVADAAQAADLSADMSASSGGAVTQEMIDAMMNGTPYVPPATSDGGAATIPSAPENTPADGVGADATEDTAADSGKKAKKQKKTKAEKPPKAPKQPKAPKGPKTVTGIREPKEKKPAGEKAPKEKKPVSSFIITVIAVIVAGALGFCASMLIYADLFHEPEESFAIRAANAVNSRLNINEKLCVYKAYVKSTSSTDECLIYAVIDYSDSVTVTRYRVVVSHDAPNTINIYYPVDETSQAYIDMKNSSDPEVRIQASVLKNYSDTIEKANREILMGSEAWKPVDISKINSSITSKQTRNTGSSAGKQPASGSEDED